jgi:hypothetical protein
MPIYDITKQSLEEAKAKAEAEQAEKPEVKRGRKPAEKQEENQNAPADGNA